MISIKDLKYGYSPKRKISFRDLSIGQGESWLLLGESGSGKTTLLHLLGGLLKSQEGIIQVNENDITKLSETNLDHFRGKHVGFVFQKNHLINALTVEKNLLLASFLAGMNQDIKRVNEVLEQLGLLDKKKSKIWELSQGQTQRVAIARAVLNKPTVILADEPTSALDDRTCNDVIEMLLDVCFQNNATLVIATHDQRLKSRVPKQFILP